MNTFFEQRLPEAGIALEPSDRGRVALSGDMLDETGAELVGMLRRLRDEGSYDLIELWVESDGGSLLPVRHFIDFTRSRGGSGRPTVATHVPTGAGSAAAVLTSLGDVRTASPLATLQYHRGRTGQVESVTATAAGRIMDRIRKADLQIIAALVDRALRSDGRAGGRRATVRDFRDSDWRVVEALLPGGKAGNRRGSLSGLRRMVENAGTAEALHQLYTQLFALDLPISAVLAVELRLLDRVGDPDERIGQRDDDGEHVIVPEWDGLYPEGRVPRAHLCRHVLLLGETGSGKSLSGILPVVAAMLGQRSPMGTMLVIDPKGEISPTIRRMGGTGVDVREIDPLTDTIDLMAGEHSIEDDLASSRVTTAANSILRRAATFDATNPANTLDGRPAGGFNDPYWANEGARLAEVIVAFVLFVYSRRADIFGTTHRASALAGLGDTVSWGAIVRFAERAGFVKGDALIDEPAEKCRRNSRHGKSAQQELVREVELSDLYAASTGFRLDFDSLLRRPEMSSLNRVPAANEKLITATIGDFAVATSLIAARSVDKPPAGGPNLLCLAGDALQSLFAGMPMSEQDLKYARAKFPAAVVAFHLDRARFKSGEIAALLDAIRESWHPLAEAPQQYCGVVGTARTVFSSFADAVPSRAIRFGCEPGDVSTLDFADAVDATDGRRRVFVYRVGLGREHQLVAKVVKATFFEAVLNNPRRRANGSAMPLACYVADEAHRFITSGVTHGEQSYVDTCRSHGAACIVATQSVSSLRHGLAAAGVADGVDVDAVCSMLIANTATKMVFRSTEGQVRRLVEELFPGGPDRLPITEIRPPL